MMINYLHYIQARVHKYINLLEVYNHKAMSEEVPQLIRTKLWNFLGEILMMHVEQH